MTVSKQYKKDRKTPTSPPCEASQYTSFTDAAPEETRQSEPRVKSGLPPKTPPELSDRYKFIRELGRGAQSTAYLAENLRNGEQLVIKQLRIDSIKTWKEYTLFHREADVLSTLDIPGVVKLYEACDYLDANPPCSYIMQEYIEGITLKEMLRSGYRFSVDQIYDIVLQIIEILEKLHRHDPCVIHRDIKPSNIILKEDSNHRYIVHLIDFGAVANAQVQSGGSTVAGTFGYMSPEQTLGRAEPASDTYALAALTTYLLSGVEPSDMTVKDLRLIIDPYIENHPRALVQTLRSMLEPNRERRLSDLSEIKRRFQSFKAGNYTIESNSCSDTTLEMWKERLSDVKYICQPQNIDIWQNLPDIPEERIDIPANFFKTCSRYSDYVLGTSSEIGDDRAKAILTTVPICVALLIIISRTNIIHSFTDLSFFLIIIPCVIYLILFSLFAKINNRTIGSNLMPYIHPESAPKKPEKCLMHQRLFKEGRKTIATITDIQFAPITKNIRAYPELRAETVPEFRISYKFNPPDDDTTEDIIHTICTHIAPEGHLKVGDPLPILYLMESSDAQKRGHVTYSMPFPFPIKDLNTPTDYIGTAPKALTLDQAPDGHSSV